MSGKGGDCVTEEASVAQCRKETHKNRDVGLADSLLKVFKEVKYSLKGG